MLVHGRPAQLDGRGSRRMDCITRAVRREGRRSPEHRIRSPWHYLPVEVGPGTRALRVDFEYDQSGGAVLDLGCLGPAGFRGWSGSARRSFVIDAEAATPGYLPGELEPGLWQIMIGTHRVPADGVEFRLTAQTTRTARVAQTTQTAPAGRSTGHRAG